MLFYFKQGLLKVTTFAFLTGKQNHLLIVFLITVSANMYVSIIACPQVAISRLGYIVCVAIMLLVTLLSTNRYLLISYPIWPHVSTLDLMGFYDCHRVLQSLQGYKWFFFRHMQMREWRSSTRQYTKATFETESAETDCIVYQRWQR